MWSKFVGQSIYFDSNIIIYSVEQGSPWLQACKEMLDAVERGMIKAVISELAIAEVLPRPFKLGNPEYIGRYQSFFHPASSIEIVPISRDILVDSARLQARRGIKLFDAIHVATAMAARCDRFMTEDERLGRAIGGDIGWLRFAELT